MERTENQIHAAARELQRKMDGHWTPRSILEIRVTVAEDLAKIRIEALDPAGDVLASSEQDPHTGAWELYRQGKITAANGMLESSRRFQEEARRVAARSAE